MGNGALGSVVQAGAGVFKPANQSAICKSWRKQAKGWCNELKAHDKNVKKWKKNGEKGPRPEMPKRSFNDRFYEDLGKTAPNIRDGIQREFPLGMQWFDGKKMNYFSMAGIANSTTGMSAEAQQMLDFYKKGAAGIGDGGLQYDKLRNDMRIESQKLFGSKGAGSAFYPDGMKDGVAIEIKGPNDAEYHDGQFEKYKQTSPKKEILVIDNTSCDPSGSITNSNGTCKK